MCDVADDTCDVWDVTHPRARKRHECMACSEPIKVGHVYRLTKSLWEGNWDRWKHCHRCAAIYEAIEEQVVDQLLAIDPRLDCGSTWEEALGDPPPPEVAALAFTLPGDPPDWFTL